MVETAVKPCHETISTAVMRQETIFTAVMPDQRSCVWHPENSARYGLDPRFGCANPGMTPFYKER